MLIKKRTGLSMAKSQQSTSEHQIVRKIKEGR